MELWQRRILQRDAKRLGELLHWLAKGNFVDEANDAIRKLEDAAPASAEENLTARCRISHMANVLYGYSGYARDREKRLREEATPDQVVSVAGNLLARIQKKLNEDGNA